MRVSKDGFAFPLVWGGLAHASYPGFHSYIGRTIEIWAWLTPHRGGGGGGGESGGCYSRFIVTGRCKGFGGGGGKLRDFGRQ